MSASGVNWKSIQWKSATPAGTSVAISVRTGDTSVPSDGSWTTFAPIAAPGALNAHSRYIQYRADLTTTDSSQTPELQDIILSTSSAPVAVNDSKAVNQDTSYTFPASGPGSLKDNDTDLDTPNAQLRAVAVTPPAHGTSSILNADGSVTYSPVSGFTGDDSFTYTISDGLLTATATVAMTVGGGTTVTAASVTPAAASKIYGSADPALTGALSGFLAADDVTAVYSRTAGETVAGSPYVISATLSPASVLGHYSITYNTANFTITNAPLTVTAGSATKVFGAPNPALPVNYSGFVNGDTPASLTTQPTVSTPATAASPVGTYPTAASAAASANYTIGYVSGNLTILQAATTTAVSASSTAFRFGAPLTLTATVAVVAPGAGTPIGSVTFMDGGTAMSGPIVAVGGVATFSTSSLLVGTHAVTAVYSGGTNFKSASSPATSITVSPDLSWATTTVADFNAGTLDAGAYISETTGGEVMLKPTMATEFSGTALPAGWFSTANITKGTLTVSNGSARLQGVQITTTSLFAAGRSLEFSATLAGDPDQTVGMFLAHFNTKMNGTTLGLYARTVTAPIVETLIPGNWYAGPHLFRVDWNATNVVYWIDGIKVVTHNVIFPAAVKMTVIGSDWMRNDVGWLVIDWMRLTPYAASGTYTSKVFNSGFLATWMNASWTANAPAGTNVVVSYRTGNTAIPDGTWTAFTTVSSSGAALSGVSQYFQFRLQETTTDPRQTPVVKDFTVTYR